MRLVRLILWSTRHPFTATLGAWEFRSGVGMTYDHPNSPRSVAYDSGRELAHIATLRHFDN